MTHQNDQECLQSCDACRDNAFDGNRLAKGYLGYRSDTVLHPPSLWKGTMKVSISQCDFIWLSTSLDSPTYFRIALSISTMRGCVLTRLAPNSE
jgi:hypothetical protein